MPGDSSASNFARLPSELEVSDNGMSVKWKLWKQSFEFYSTAIQLANKEPEVQVAIFMSAIGPAATVIFNTFELTEDDRKNLPVIKQRFDDYFSPKPNETYTRYLFFSCLQGKHETFDSYYTKLKTKVTDCSFGTLQDSLLRDQVVRGICSDKVREILLAERELTLNKAIDICRASEQATNQLKDMHASESLDKDVLSVKYSKSKQIKKVDSSKSKVEKEKQIKSCWRCNLSHDFGNCPAFNSTCRNCNKKGHYARQCKFQVKQKQARKMKMHELLKDSSDAENLSCDTLHIGELLHRNKKAWFTTVTFHNGFSVNFKLDTGAEADVVTKSVVDKLSLPLKKSPVRRLKSFNNGYIPVMGEIDVNCTIQNQSVKLKLIVVEGDFSCILGCKTCEELGLIKRNVELVQLNEIKFNVPDKIFDGIGCIKNFEYDIEFEEHAKFAIHPPRRIPYALRNIVKKEIDNMVKMNILKPVTHPTPAVSPLVIVKKGEKVRICMDPSDLNKVIKRRHFPLKTVEDIAARVGTAKFFTLLDAKRGFWQLRVTERTSDYLTVNTPWGRYSFLRVPFGIASAPEIFQQVMQSILTGLRNVECSMDDIFIWANTQEELSKLTEKVLQRLAEHGVRLNKEKCVFSKPKVKFLGHIFSSEGIEIDPSKIKAIRNLKTPTCVTELQRFIGMVNYVSKFIPNYSTISEPLRRLLQKHTLWEWSSDQEHAFLRLKEALENTPKLAYYDVNKPIILSVDASSYATGAVLFQEGRPVAYSTRALTSAQQRYPQIEKEALAILHGCKKFHDYIYGKPVVIETDHKPLEAIAKKPLQLAPPRLQRILFDVLRYSPQIVYKRGSEIPIPDALSRDCTLDAFGLPNDYEEIETFEVAVDVPLPIITIAELVSATNEDSELQQLKSVILNGWPHTIMGVPAVLRKYWNYREELSTYENLLFKAERLIVPKLLKEKYLKYIHQGHLGINLSLQRAREIVFWHGMSKDVEDYVQQCSICQQTSSAPKTEPLLMKPVPQFPWQRVATDLFELFGKTYCLVVDSYSGFFDFKHLDHPTSENVVDYLKDSFAVHGIPDTLESDNGPQYRSGVFHKFTREWKIKHQTSSPNFPQSNGLAERYVQIAKLILKRCKIEGSDFRLALLNWRNTPRQSLPSPAERLFGRPTRTLIPLHPAKRLPRMPSTVPLQLSREKQRQNSTTSAKTSSYFVEGDVVKLKTDHRNWIPATVVSTANAPRSYIVSTPEGKIYRRNTEVIRHTKATIPPEREVVSNSSSPPVSQPASSAIIQSEPPPPKKNSTLPPSLSNTVKTRFGRVIRPPDKLNL